jgi:hypothetical protein
VLLRGQVLTASPSLQDFDFPEASNKVKSTRDGQYVLATGTYKPRMKVFDLEELSLKTERFTDSENIDFCVRPPPSLDGSPAHTRELLRRSYPQTGPRLSTFRPTDQWSCTRRRPPTTACECLDTDEHSPTTSLPATPSSVDRATKSGGSTSRWDAS